MRRDKYIVDWMGMYHTWLNTDMAPPVEGR
jgi:hypothetical protein